ncbi:hypothetical protein DI392_08200 [Vibrio albus]|uniref:Uncharacterized protein n=1 Tax=Vibrio albus TaxID=2200953 RepID=A0A2U3BBI8_9VIBR|nr:hypothetical protein DI392_08200 [Vibrio albus]
MLIPMSEQEINRFKELQDVLLQPVKFGVYWNNWLNMTLRVWDMVLEVNPVTDVILMSFVIFKCQLRLCVNCTN